MYTFHAFCKVVIRNAKYNALWTWRRKYQREISASIILQAQSQLKAIYKDYADTIVGNCDSTLFLGVKEKTIVREFI